MHQVDVSALTRLECLVLENIVPHYKTWAVPDNCRVSLQGGVDMLEHYASLRFGHPQQPLVSRMAQQLTGLHILHPFLGKPMTLAISLSECLISLLGFMITPCSAD